MPRLLRSETMQRPRSLSIQNSCCAEYRLGTGLDSRLRSPRGHRPTNQRVIGAAFCAAGAAASITCRKCVCVASVFWIARLLPVLDQVVHLLHPLDGRPTKHTRLRNLHNSSSVFQIVRPFQRFPPQPSTLNSHQFYNRGCHWMTLPPCYARPMTLGPPFRISEFHRIPPSVSKAGRVGPQGNRARGGTLWTPSHLRAQQSQPVTQTSVELPPQLHYPCLS